MTRLSRSYPLTIGRQTGKARRLLFSSLLHGLAVLLLVALPSAGQQARRIGSEVQLVVDDELFASREGLVRRVHACEKLSRPVLVPEMPWEGLRVYLYGTVLGDGAAGPYRMWYMSRNQDRPARDPGLTYARADMVLFATSTDGIAWNRPELGLYEYGRSTKNNIVFGLHSPSVLYDAADPEPSRRYKMLGYGHSGEKTGYCGAVSADGLHWNGVGGNPVLKYGDTITLAYDASRREYLAYHKRPGTERGYSRRMVYLATSRDFSTWTEPQRILVPDVQDDLWAKAPGERTEFYNLSVFRYGAQFLGLVTVFKHQRDIKPTSPGQSSADGPIYVQLVHSRDGHRWHRFDDRSPVIPNGPYPYDAGCILGTGNGPVLAGNEMWIYYTAITTTHGGAMPQKQISIARAAWPRDRFVSLDAAAAGRLETVLLRGDGKSLHLNADASVGRVVVEALDGDGRVIPGYSAAECQPLKGNRFDHAIRWQTAHTLPATTPIRLRFYLDRASLYSFSLVSVSGVGGNNTAERRP